MEDKGDLISLTGHSIKHLGKGGENNDSMIRTTKPIDLKIEIFYFEMTVRQPGDGGAIAIGLTKSNVKSRNGELPGWSDDSIGYHGDDGGIFHNSGSSVASSDPYSTGDTVGCGLKNIMIGQEMYRLCFFTLNGQKVAHVRILDDGDFFPTVGLADAGAEVDTNFGHNAFVYDLEGITTYYLLYIDYIQMTLRRSNQYGIFYFRKHPRSSTTTYQFT